MILDAGCGNRAMWQEKNNPDILFIDIERKLSVKPSLFASNSALPFTSETFDTVFFDPPFAWDVTTHPFFSYPNKELQQERGYKVHGEIPTYYGIERYKTRSALVAYIYRAEKELHRILKNDGVLWLRWCEMRNMTHNQVLAIFQNWRLLLTHELNSSKQVLSMRESKKDNLSYWFMLMKKPLTFTQHELEVS